MPGLFEERERAAETAFVHQEELRFLAHRRAIQSLAAWAAQSMEYDAERARQYVDALLDAFVTKAPDDRLVERVQGDLEAAGKPSLTTQVGPTLTRALAAAQDELRGRTPREGSGDPLSSWSSRHPTRTTWGSLRF